jgi:hypothetical protein
LCRKHHRLKHAGFDVTINHLGTLTWTTPTGRTYDRTPTALPHAPMPGQTPGTAFAPRPIDDEPPPF